MKSILQGKDFNRRRISVQRQELKKKGSEQRHKQLERRDRNRVERILP